MLLAAIGERTEDGFIMEMRVDFGAALDVVKDRLAAGGHEAVVRHLHDHFPHYSWVGIYWVDGADLVLGPWNGPAATEHTRIPIGTGICGAAAASGQTEVVDDVNQDPRYLSCFLNTKSEIVVPIIREGRVIGEIDIDSDTPAAFRTEDRMFLEEVAALIAAQA